MMSESLLSSHFIQSEIIHGLWMMNPPLDFHSLHLYLIFHPTVNVDHHN